MNSLDWNKNPEDIFLTSTLTGFHHLNSLTFSQRLLTHAEATLLEIIFTLNEQQSSPLVHSLVYASHKDCSDWHWSIYQVLMTLLQLLSPLQLVEIMASLRWEFHLHFIFDHVQVVLRVMLILTSVIRFPLVLPTAAQISFEVSVRGED